MASPSNEAGDDGAIVVVALLKMKPGQSDDAIEAFRPVIENTHRERGCLSYALHRDQSNPDMGELAAKMLAEPPRILFCEPIDMGDPAKGSI